MVNPCQIDDAQNCVQQQQLTSPAHATLPLQPHEHHQQQFLPKESQQHQQQLYHRHHHLTQQQQQPNPVDDKTSVRKNDNTFLPNPRHAKRPRWCEGRPQQPPPPQSPRSRRQATPRVGSRQINPRHLHQPLQQKQKQQQQQQPMELWDQSSHRAFVAAVYEVGMKHSSPSIILEQMTSKPSNLTTERVKSHLQKYRLNKPKGREDFLTEYDEWMDKNHRLCSADEDPSVALELLLQPRRRRLDAGSMAAYLTFSVMHEFSNQHCNNSKNSNHKTVNSNKGSNTHGQDPYSDVSRTGNNSNLEFLQSFMMTESFPMTFPSLTDAEKKSSLGQALACVMGLCLALKERHSSLRNNKKTTHENDGQAIMPLLSLAAPPPPPTNGEEFFPVLSSATLRALSRSVEAEEANTNNDQSDALFLSAPPVVAPAAPARSQPPSNGTATNQLNAFISEHHHHTDEV